MPSSVQRLVPQRAVLRPLSTALLGLLPLLGGCSVAVLDSAQGDTIVNECSDNSDCKGGVCTDGRCRASQGFFSTVLVEISAPSSGDPAFAGLDYLHRLDNLELAGGQREVLLAAPVQVTGTVTFQPYTVGAGDEACQLEFLGDDPELRMLANPAGIPVSVSFTPSDRILGVASTKYTAAVDTRDYERAEPFQAPPLSFGINVPPGEYDIYVQPRQAAEGGCEIPPTLLRRYQVEVANVELGLDLPQPASFGLTVRMPITDDQKSLEGWTVDMLDPLTAHVISTKAVLGSPLTRGSKLEYETRIAYAPVTLDAELSERVRLSPPPDVDAPTIVLARSGLELFSPGTGVIEQFLGYPDTVEVEGRLTIAGDAEPTAGTVTVVSTRLEGVGEGVFASFVRTAEADSDGSFTMRLLPGTYRVYASPAASGTAADSETEWEIASEPELQAGKAVELLPPAHLTGSVFLPLQGDPQPAAGAVVTAVASPRDNQGEPLTQAVQGDLSVSPGVQSSIVDSAGYFDLLADPGVFDVSVRPPEGSGFAWYVASHVHVQPVSAPELAVQSLGTPNLPLPVPYTGRVLVSSDESSSVPLPEALLRAYVYLDGDGKYTGDPTRAASMVQIGETRADIDGNFELLIPANLN